MTPSLEYLPYLLPKIKICVCASLDSCPSAPECSARDHDGSYTVEGRCSPLEGLQTGFKQPLWLTFTKDHELKLGQAWYVMHCPKSPNKLTSSALCCKKQPPIGKPGGRAGCLPHKGASARYVSTNPKASCCLMRS